MPFPAFAMSEREEAAVVSGAVFRKLWKHIALKHNSLRFGDLVLYWFHRTADK